MGGLVVAGVERAATAYAAECISRTSPPRGRTDYHGHVIWLAMASLLQPLPFGSRPQSAFFVALGPFTQEVVGASIRASRDTAAC